MNNILGSSLAPLKRANTVQLARADLVPRAEMSPSVDWNRHLMGLFKLIMLKLHLERLNQTSEMGCRAS